MIRRSTTFGKDRKEESRNAIRKRPGPPSASPALCSQSNSRDIAQSVDYRGIRSRVPFLIAVAVTVAGAAAAIHYAHAGLTVSHYDARAHLVVARRIFDSLMPGWQQIGGVWLPLPHVLNALPVQVDALYRNGASGTIFSVLSMGAAAWGLAALLMRVTGSQLAAILGSFLLLANPNTLYLQSTPMTEPMLFGTTLVCIALTAAWLDRGAPLPPRAAGLAMMAACMTRYEAWPIS